MNNLNKIDGFEFSIGAGLGARIGVLLNSSEDRFQLLLSECLFAAECIAEERIDAGEEICLSEPILTGDDFLQINKIIDSLFNVNVDRDDVALLLSELNGESIYFIIGCCRGTVDLLAGIERGQHGHDLPHTTH